MPKKHKQRFEHEVKRVINEFNVASIIADMQIDGWEIVAATVIDDDTHYLFFKRPV